jgi:outer membrane protein assembly factor BamB
VSMKSRNVVAIILGAMLILAGAGCRREVPPDRPGQASGPDRTWTGIPTTYTVSAHIDRGTIRFVTDWGDMVDTTDAGYASGETATITHVWTLPGTMSVRVQAINSAAPEQASLWSFPESVDVILDSLPVIKKVDAPSIAMRGVEVYFDVHASDPDGDSIRIRVDWGDGKDTASDYHQGPYYSGFCPTHAFTQVETAKVIVTAQDRKGATSLPETVLVRVDTIGGVIWFDGAPWASPLVVNDGGENCVYFKTWPSSDPGRGAGFRALTTAGDHKHYVPDGPSPSAAAYCAATQHIVGAGAGLMALDRQLHVAWYLETPESTGWGDPAVSSNRIYVGNDNGSLYCFIDSIDHGVRAATFAPQGGIAGAPVIDAQGSVYFGTDSGYLYKIGPELDTVFWGTRLTTGGRIRSPIVGSAGTVFCASDASRIYAIEPATGTQLWTGTVLGVPRPLTLGRTAIFVATSAGYAYSIDPATGVVNWSKHLTTDEGIRSTPAVSADGYVYFLSEHDVLYRVRQMDGTLDWACDCGYFAGGYGLYIGRPYPGKRAYNPDYPPNTTILPNGNIIVAGRYALYCVAGSPAGPLDPLAPWPKWQHDLHNTGYVGGGR